MYLFIRSKFPLTQKSDPDVQIRGDRSNCEYGKYYLGIFSSLAEQKQMSKFSSWKHKVNSWNPHKLCNFRLNIWADVIKCEWIGLSCNLVGARSLYTIYPPAGRQHLIIPLIIILACSTWFSLLARSPKYFLTLLGYMWIGHFLLDTEVTWTLQSWTSPSPGDLGGMTRARVRNCQCSKWLGWVGVGVGVIELGISCWSCLWHEVCKVPLLPRLEKLVQSSKALTTKCWPDLPYINWYARILSYL